MIRLTDGDGLPAALAAMRSSRGITRATLAELADMKATQYGTYENGRVVPNIEQVLRLAEAADHDVILVPREITTVVSDLREAIPASLLAALALIIREDRP